jgi:DNA polymerase type B, organellar and viral
MDKAQRKAKLRRLRYEQTDKAKERRSRYETKDTTVDKRSQYATSDARKAAMLRYEQGTGKATRAALADREYIERPVIAIDGEGITVDGKHKYVLLALSTGDQLLNVDGIDSKTALVWLMDMKAKYPTALFVSFGFGYDVNKILKDVNKKMLSRLRKDEYLQFGEWRFWWRPGKCFGVGKDLNLTVWDLRSFFRGSFISACELLLDDVPKIITDGKARRNVFTVDNLDDVITYNSLELEYMQKLGEQIRLRLFDVGIKLSRFDGAGAIASAIMRNYEVKEHLPEPSETIQKVTAGAFIGGRIECVQYGHSKRGGYQYDMRAAYPWAMSQLPSFKGTWTHHKKDPGQLPYTIYKVKWDSWKNPLQPAPLPFRTKNNTIIFPSVGTSYVWSPEVDLLRNMPADMFCYDILEAWQFVPSNPDIKPFKFVQELYDMRQTLDKQGNTGAATVLKLGTNAMWGKMAQRLGWSDQKKPTYHHLGAAGLVTSMVRAEVYKVALQDLDSVIAIETDALITRRRLPAHKTLVGNSMGQWKETKYKELTYCNTGLAFGVLDSGVKIARTSGVPKGVLDVEMILQAGAKGLEAVEIQRPYFIDVVTCTLKKDWNKFGEWITNTDKVSLRPTGKRIALPTPTTGKEWSRWNYTVCPVLPKETSSRYLVPWDLEKLDLEKYLEQEYKDSQAQDF